MPNSLPPIADWASTPLEQPQVIAFAVADVWGVQFERDGVVLIEHDGPIFSPNMPAGNVTATVIGMDGGRRVLTTPPAPRVIRGQTDPVIGSGAVWLDGCTFTRTPATTNAGPLYMTDCTVRNAARGVGNSPSVRLVRGCRFYDLTEDACQNVPTVIDLEVHGITGSKAGNHSDVLQVFGDSGGPFIWYRVMAEDVGYQGIAARTANGIDGLAIVECSIRIKPPIEGAGNYIQGPLHNAVIRGNTLTGYSGDPGYGCDFWCGSDPVSKRGEWTDVVFDGNTIGVYRIYTTQFTRVTWTNNVWGGIRKDGRP